jgi:putative ABC transport system permease protein
VKFLPLILGGLRRKKLRTILTVLAILVAFLLFGVLCAVREALAGGIQIEGKDRLIVRDKVSIIQLLPVSYKERIERIPGVTLATHQTWFGGIYQDPKNFFMQTPVEPEEFLDIHPELLVPADQKTAWLKLRTGAIVGRKTATRFGWKIGDQVPIRSTIWRKPDGNLTWTFDIVGIYDGRDKTTDTTALFFRYDYFDETRQNAKGQVGWYTIRIKDGNQAAQVAQLIDKEFENSSSETKTEPEGAFVQSFAKQIGDIALITAVIMGAVFFTLLLVTGNTMAQAVRERTGELGVLKAVGFTHLQVMALVLAESCILALLGGGLGLGIAWLEVTLTGDPTGSMLPLFHLPATDLWLGAALALALGFLTGIVPAFQAMHLRVADALRKM